MTGADVADAGDPWAPWRAKLVDAGLLVPAGANGLWGRSGTFEGIVTGLERAVRDLAVDQEAQVLRFAPVVTEEVFERTDYVRSFPDLIGAVRSFRGDDRAHARLLATVDEGGDWAATLASAGTALCSAACHPLYSTIPGPLPPGGRRWDVYGWVFRHEPSLDPARMQAFRQYEIVYVGEPEGALRHRDLWLERALDLHHDLHLEVGHEVANDPFFGRLGKMLAANQQEAALKWEVVAPTGPAAKLTAITSANCHEDHFGVAFAIMTADGGVAHSACVGFGVERIALALLWNHGLDPEAWPSQVKAKLWP